MWGSFGLNVQTYRDSPAYVPGFTLVPKGSTVSAPFATPKRKQYKLRGGKVFKTYLLLSCLLHNLIKQKPNGWAAIKMVFTCPSYMFVTQYSVLLNVRPGLGQPVLHEVRIRLHVAVQTGRHLNRRDVLKMFHRRDRVWLCFGKNSNRAMSKSHNTWGIVHLNFCPSQLDLIGILWMLKRDTGFKGEPVKWITGVCAELPVDTAWMSGCVSPLIDWLPAQSMLG